MSVEQTPTTEMAGNTPVETPVTPATPDTTPVETKTEAPVAPPMDPAAPVTPPPYSPNTKFKVLDKEMDFDEFIKPALKDKDTEAKVRELYEKAYGLDTVKEERKRVKEDFKKLDTEHKQIVQGLQELNYLKDNDLDAFFEAAKIPRERILQQVMGWLNYQQLTPEQRREFDDNTATRRKAFSQERQLQEMQQSYQQQVAQFREMQVDTAIMNPDVMSAANAFDSRRGKVGAFKDLVYMIGNNHFHSTGQDIPVQQAIQEALAMVGQVAPAQAPSAPQSTPAPQRPPVIPNVGGGKGTSVVHKEIKSIADLENTFNEKFGRN